MRDLKQWVHSIQVYVPELEDVDMRRMQHRQVQLGAWREEQKEVITV